MFNDYRRKVKRTFTDVEKADFLEQQIFLTPEEHLETQADIQRLWSHINQLKDSYREVLILRDIQELSYEEVAEILNWTLSKVKTTLHRARLELKRKLHCEEFNK
ncbi:sigma-70 family RNA polymerase sigma factor [Bacillus sp. EKM104P]|uniref:sigma-70 family RNA polymerase sigma factor n=1 Tax=Bacillus sp. EKM104P TaxID=2708091 RepID=UPI001F0F55E1|nr:MULTISPECIES: sigma-70 family RNA polymerase sigma factor [unclassified Bacillus (in: firmicutes)]